MKYYGYAKSEDVFFPSVEIRVGGKELYVLGFEFEKGYCIYKDRIEEFPYIDSHFIDELVKGGSWKEIQNPFTDRAETKKLLEEILKEFDAMMDRPEISYPSLLINKIKETIEKL